jgi:polyhydroxyalkanoate synthesis regulator phasin
MATAVNRILCIKCDKENKAVFKCGGCLQDFCFIHGSDHRQHLGKILDEVVNTHDLFRQTLIEQTTDLKNHASMQEIDEWEHDSIKKIQQTAEEVRQLLLKHTTEHFTKIEVQLSNLTDQLQQSRTNDDFIETDLRRWKDELDRLREELTKKSNAPVRQSDLPCVTKIYVDLTGMYTAVFRWCETSLLMERNFGSFLFRKSKHTYL